MKNLALHKPTGEIKVSRRCSDKYKCKNFTPNKEFYSKINLAYFAQVQGLSTQGNLLAAAHLLQCRSFINAHLSIGRLKVCMSVLFRSSLSVA
jgi:hypothetical protein